MRQFDKNNRIIQEDERTMQILQLKTLDLLEELSQPEAKILLELLTLGMYKIKTVNYRSLLIELLEFRVLPIEDICECLFYEPIRPKSKMDCSNCTLFSLCERHGYFESFRERVGQLRSVFE